MALHLYLSPHLDDAVLSCGGLIYRQVRAGDTVRVLTVFAGDPPPGAHSPFADELRARWRGVADPVGLRRAEDQAALERLGATPVHWEYPDCVFRRDPASGASYYPDRNAIFGDVHPAERTAVVEALAARLQGYCDRERPQAVYSLLTAGHHVDHQLLQWASRRLAGSWALRFYEDYPYVEDPERVQAALQATGDHWQAELEPLSEDALQAKIEAIACYRSQLSSLFAEGTMPQRVGAYARSHTPVSFARGLRRWRWRCAPRGSWRPFSAMPSSSGPCSSAWS